MRDGDQNIHLVAPHLGMVRSSNNYEFVYAKQLILFTFSNGPKSHNINKGNDSMAGNIDHDDQKEDCCDS